MFPVREVSTEAPSNKTSIAVSLKSMANLRTLFSVNFLNEKDERKKVDT